MKKVVAITGAGSVENAWNPVINFLENHLESPLTSDQVNSYLAKKIYEKRFFSKNNLPEAKEYKIQLEEEIKCIKEGICMHLHKGMQDGVLKPRSEFDFLLDKYIFNNGHQIIHYTTNWDTVIEDYINQQTNSKIDIPTIYLHGSIRDDKMIYLPTEIIHENYRHQYETQHLHHKHFEAWNEIAGANELLIYGLSLSPLDAELVQMITSSVTMGKVNKIYVIDPFYQMICDRIKVLIGRNKPIQLIGIDPLNIKNEVSF